MDILGNHQHLAKLIIVQQFGKMKQILVLLKSTAKSRGFNYTSNITSPGLASIAQHYQRDSTKYSPVNISPPNPCDSAILKLLLMAKILKANYHLAQIV